MGNKAGKVVALKPKDVTRLSDATRFSESEVRALYGQFLSLKGEDHASTADLRISAAEFQAALGFKHGESIFLGRIFQLFDDNKDGLITFEEFIVSIAALTPTAAPEARMKGAWHSIAAARARAGHELRLRPLAYVTSARSHPAGSFVGLARARRVRGSAVFTRAPSGQLYTCLLSPAAAVLFCPLAQSPSSCTTRSAAARSRRAT
jgi:Ca2+-binding EF-hand superfamily protein